MLLLNVLSNKKGNFSILYFVLYLVILFNKLLAYRSLKITLKYIQLLDVPQEERFISKIANNAKEAKELVELGFTFVTGEYDDGGKIFKKRDLSYLGS